MKKAAVIIYPDFCTYEFSVALEMFAMAEMPIMTFAKNHDPVRSEEGLLALSDRTYKNLNVEEFDALVLTGTMGLHKIINDGELLEIIRRFDQEKKIIAAISCAPMLLLKAGILGERKIYAAVEKKWFLPEGEFKEANFSMEEMENILDYRHGETKGYHREDNIVTAMGWWFREWAMELGEMLEIETWPQSFGLEKEWKGKLPK